MIEVQNNNKMKYSFTGVPDTDSRACFNRSTWSPAATATWDITSGTGGQLGQSASKFEDILDHYGNGIWRCDNSQLFRMVELMNPGRIPNVMILVGTNNISRSSDVEEVQWESIMVCLFTTLWRTYYSLAHIYYSLAHILLSGAHTTLWRIYLQVFVLA